LCEGKFEHSVPIYPVSIYPNPVNSLTNISLIHPEIEKVKATIINQLGQSVYAFELNQNATKQLDLSLLKPGVYYLKFNSSLLETQRIIKK